MKGLFCYDGPISCDQNGKYYGTVINDQVFSRYLCVVDDLGVAIRVNTDVSNNDKKSQITLESVKILNIPDLSTAMGQIHRKQARKLLEKSISEVDVLFIRLPSFIGNLAISIAERLRKPYLIELVGCPWDSLWNHSFKGKLVAPHMWAITRWNLSRAKYVVYVTNCFLQDRYPTRGVSVNCSNVDLPATNKHVLIERLERIFNRTGKVILGTAAAVDVRYKGQQHMIRAISELRRMGIDCEYQLVGWGDSRYLRGIAKQYNVEQNVKFMGVLPHSEIFAWLDTIDIYAQPSKQEGLPRALIEAMSRGCPAIGAKSGGIPELLEKDFVFSNRRSNITEICDIIHGFSTEKMALQAKRNFREAEQYERTLIQARRESFFTDFVSNAKRDSSD